ncbi:hypothetical protein V2S66_20905 [Streptomyces sp. V4-01]|uniref:Secreted protein n=1 Tax=Actinacidiphila polyblastidii TaxID=3110430 RepID=A0ABU7PF44_9ACTN|nr:hypothetical protein [Streptomyces sp. V4-01]
MISRTRNHMAVAAGVAVLAFLAGGSATAAPQNTVQPQAVPGGVIAGGADGAPRTLLCPPEENAMGGGFAVSAPHGGQLDATPTDVLENHPNADSTGWVVSVRKNATVGQGHQRLQAADLTVYVVCTQGENTPSG